jgi:PAS domain S-box-containing protein
LVAAQCVLPGVHLAYAQIVPLLLLRRTLGFRVTIVLAVIAAPALAILDFALRMGSGPFAFILRHAFLLGSALGPNGEVSPATPAGFDPVETLLPAGSAQVAALFDGALLGLIFVSVLTLVERRQSMMNAAFEAEREARRKLRSAARTREIAALAEGIPQLVWTYGTDGAGEYFNAAWTAYTGLEPAVLHARGIEAALHPDDFETVRNARLASSSSQRFIEVEVRLRDRDGEYAWFAARATPLYGDDGETIRRWFGTYTEVEARPERLKSAPAPQTTALGTAASPLALPQVAGLRFDAVQRADASDSGAGRHWYDAFPLLDGRVVLSVGDVAANGLAAAVAMAAVRQSIRGAAGMYADPLAILEAADRALRVSEPGAVATAFVGIFDPIEGSLSFGNAGHPAPLLRAADGTVRELAAPGSPLGLWQRATAEGAQTAVGPESLLILYTAGLRTAAREPGGGGLLIEALADGGIARANAPAQALARAVLPAAPGAGVAILTALFPASGESEASESIVRRSFEAREPAALREVRVRFGAAFASVGLSPKERGDAETILAELLANVVRHAPGPCEVVFDVSGALPVLAVLDRGRNPLTHAANLPPEAYARFGRGLFIVRALCAEFTAAPRLGGGTHARAVLQVDSAFGRRPDCMDIASTIRTA